METETVTRLDFIFNWEIFGFEWYGNLVHIVINIIIFNSLLPLTIIIA